MVKGHLNDGGPALLERLVSQISEKSGRTVVIEGDMRSSFSMLFNKMRTRWQSVKRQEDKFHKKYEEWLNIHVSFPVPATSRKTPANKDAPMEKRRFNGDAVPSCNLSTSTDILRARSKNKLTETMEFTAEPPVKQSLSDGLVSIKSKVLEPETETPGADIIEQEHSLTMQRNANEPIHIDELMIKGEPEIKDEPLHMDVDKMHEYDCPESRFDNDTEEINRLALKDESEDFEESEIKSETIDLPDIYLNDQMEEIWKPVPASQDNDGRKAEGSKRKYKCQDCDTILASKQGLKKHVLMRERKTQLVTCEICEKVCANHGQLVRHLKSHNKPKEKIQREYLCQLCSKVYVNSSSLSYHMRTHTGVKPYVCKICNTGFTTSTSLTVHQRIHTGDKPFVCHVCSAAFAVSSGFRRHLTRHTGEANYLCKTCGKAFKRLSTLKEHTYTHSGEKPYVCKTCGAAFSHSGSLSVHHKRCRVQYGEIIEERSVTHNDTVKIFVRAESKTMT